MFNPVKHILHLLTGVENIYEPPPIDPELQTCRDFQQEMQQRVERLQTEVRIRERIKANLVRNASRPPGDTLDLAGSRS